MNTIIIIFKLLTHGPQHEPVQCELLYFHRIK